MWFRKACLTVSLVIALAGTAAGEGPGQEMSCAGWAASAEATSATEAVRLFDVGDDPVAVQEFFRTRRVAVAALAEVLSPQDDGWRVRLGYTSFNYGPDGRGSDVIYPHEATLIGGVDRTPPAERESGVLLVLEVDPGAAFSYSWVGCALPTDGVALDWFANRPELLYRGEEASPGR